MTTWNYRVCITDDGSYEIHEVYYDSLDRPEYRTDRRVSPWGQSLTELKKEFEMMKAAFDKPVLTQSDFNRPGTRGR